MRAAAATKVANFGLPLFDPIASITPGRAAKSVAMSGYDFLKYVRTFCEFGSRTVEAFVDGIPYLANEFWTSGQRQAHSLHEVSYRACFKPQLPEFFISKLTSSGDGVLDPFMGRGTTPVQAALMGRRPIGNDINPLSVLLTRPRMSPPPLAAVANRLQRAVWRPVDEPPKELLAFYHPETLTKLCALREWFLREAPLADAKPEPAIDWLRMVAINRLTGHSPGFFSVYTLPPNQATSVANQQKINAKRSQVPPARDVSAIIMKKSRQLLRDGHTPDCADAILGVGPADCLRYVPTASVTLVVTSPPFLDVVQYAADNWLRCWFAGILVKDVEIAMHRTEAAWEKMVRSSLIELARVVRPGGHVAFEVGEVRGGNVLLERLVWRAVEGLPFKRLAVIVNQQEFTKTANCWGVSNNAKGTNTNRIVFMQRIN